MKSTNWQQAFLKRGPIASVCTFRTARKNVKACGRFFSLVFCMPSDNSRTANRRPSPRPQVHDRRQNGVAVGSSPRSQAHERNAAPLAESEATVPPPRDTFTPLPPRLQPQPAPDGDVPFFSLPPPAKIEPHAEVEPPAPSLLARAAHASAQALFDRAQFLLGQRLAGAFDSCPIFDYIPPDLFWAAIFLIGVVLLAKRFYFK